MAGARTHKRVSSTQNAKRKTRIRCKCAVRRTTFHVHVSCRRLPTVKRKSNPSTLSASRARAILAGGYWHCTTPAAFRLIAREGAILPNLGRFTPRSGVTPVSHCYRAGGVSLFEPTSKGSFLAAWLTVHKPVTVALQLNPRKVEERVLSHERLRESRIGLVLRGEVCHPGPVPVEWCTGCLLTHAESGDARWLDTADPREISCVIRELKAAANGRPTPQPPPGRP